MHKKLSVLHMQVYKPVLLALFLATLSHLSSIYKKKVGGLFGPRPAILLVRRTGFEPVTF